MAGFEVPAKARNSAMSMYGSSYTIYDLCDPFHPSRDSGVRGPSRGRHLSRDKPNGKIRVCFWPLPDVRGEPRNRHPEGKPGLPTVGLHVYASAVSLSNLARDIETKT